MSENYQALSSKLDEVLAKLQAPDVGVDEAVRLYGEGMQLAARLEKHLQSAENKLTKLQRGK